MITLYLYKEINIAIFGFIPLSHRSSQRHHPRERHCLDYAECTAHCSLIFLLPSCHILIALSDGVFVSLRRVICYLLDCINEVKNKYLIATLSNKVIIYGIVKNRKVNHASFIRHPNQRHRRTPYW